MARQKVSTEEVQRQEMEVVSGKEEITEPTEANETKVAEESGSEGSEAESTSSEQGTIELDEDLLQVDHPSLYTLGNAAEKEGNNDRAIQCYQGAIHKYVAGGNSEVSAAIADYWLAYGNMLLKVEEQTAGLFSGGPDDTGDDNLKIAWESLDVARVCYQKKLDEMEAAGLVKKQDCEEAVNSLCGSPDAMGDGKAAENESTEPPQLWKLNSYPEDVLKSLRNAVFTRLRLGDFCQVHMKHEEAISEFSSALKLCFNYGLPYSEGLQAVVPLAHSYVGTGDPKAVSAFKFAVMLIDAEMPTAGPERKAILEDFKPDLIRQMEDFEEEEVKLVAESEQMAEELVALEKMDDGEPVDLGRVGGGRRQTREDQKS